MSQVLLQEAIAIGKQLSTPERAQLIESISGQLRQDLAMQPGSQKTNGTNGSANQTGNGHDTSDPTDSSVAKQEILPDWTLKDIRAMMAPDPRTGKEIAALIESGEIDTSIGAEMEIDDVVTWLDDLRSQERIERGLEA